MRIEITERGIYDQDGNQVPVGKQLDVPDDFHQWANKYRVLSDTQTKTLEPATPSDEDDLEAARAEYERQFGERPHARMKADTIRARLADSEG